MVTTSTGRDPYHHQTHQKHPLTISPLTCHSKIYHLRHHQVLQPPAPSSRTITAGSHNKTISSATLLPVQLIRWSFSSATLYPRVILLIGWRIEMSGSAVWSLLNLIGLWIRSRGSQVKSVAAQMNPMLFTQKSSLSYISLQKPVSLDLLVLYQISLQCLGNQGPELNVLE